MIDTAWASAAELASAISHGEATAAAVIDQTLARIERRNRVLNAFTLVTHERARARGATLPKGPLAGVPFAVWNLFNVAELPTHAGSKINREHPPATADATLIQRLEAAGAILVGALNVGEYAYDFTGENCHDGPSRNPHDPTRMTGGSSGGSGGAVAGGLVPIASGSDTNGSIRLVIVLRCLRAEADLQPVIPCRQLPVRFQPRSPWTICAQHDGPGIRP
jgi:Asp-tRNA(Asn)/Glu-tRNA(Gln) amidotransferase A subunit family amidase